MVDGANNSGAILRPAEMETSVRESIVQKVAWILRYECKCILQNDDIDPILFWCGGLRYSCRVSHTTSKHFCPTRKTRISGAFGISIEQVKDKKAEVAHDVAGYVSIEQGRIVDVVNDANDDVSTEQVNAVEIVNDAHDHVPIDSRGLIQSIEIDLPWEIRSFAKRLLEGVERECVSCYNAHFYRLIAAANDSGAHVDRALHKSLVELDLGHLYPQCLFSKTCKKKQTYSFVLGQDSITSRGADGPFSIPGSSDYEIAFAGMFHESKDSFLIAGNLKLGEVTHMSVAKLHTRAEAYQKWLFEQRFLGQGDTELSVADLHESAEYSGQLTFPPEFAPKFTEAAITRINETMRPHYMPLFRTDNQIAMIANDSVGGKDLEATVVGPKVRQKRQRTVEQAIGYVSLFVTELDKLKETFKDSKNSLPKITYTYLARFIGSRTHRSVASRAVHNCPDEIQKRFYLKLKEFPNSILKYRDYRWLNRTGSGEHSKAVARCKFTISCNGRSFLIIDIKHLITVSYGRR